MKNKEKRAGDDVLVEDIDDLERCRRVREEIDRRFATLDEYLDWAQELDRKAQARRRKTTDAAASGDSGNGATSKRRRRKRTPEEIELLINGEEVQRLRRVREEIASRFKTIDEYFDWLVEQDRQRRRTPRRKPSTRQRSRGKET
jgi:hypothetical protein